MKVKMFKVIANIDFGIDDTYDAEYSGIEHETQEAAKKELYEAKLHEIDCEYINNLYIKEY